MPHAPVMSSTCRDIMLVHDCEINSMRDVTFAGSEQTLLSSATDNMGMGVAEAASLLLITGRSRS